MRQLRDANRSVLLVLMVVMMASNTRYGSGGTNGPSLAFGGGQVRCKKCKIQPKVQKGFNMVCYSMASSSSSTLGELEPGGRA